ncbi:MAG: ROK family protein, partial [Chloroflexota bacterium]|nr:ROK family protein [Chloroflexota bacterium]
MAGHVIAIDLGGTNIRGALVRADGHVEKRESVRTNAQEGPETVIARIADVVGIVSEEAGADIPVGIASPGPLDPCTGAILFTPNVPGWRDVPLVSALEIRTGRRVALQNDGNCGALGEAAFGSAKGVRGLVYLALGTGIGGGVISNGVLIDGAQGFGAVVGHVVVALDGPLCTWGSVVCLEAFTSGWAIRREAELVAATADGDRLKELAGNSD